MDKNTNYFNFYVLKPSNFSFDKYYKMFVTNHSICGAKIAGQITDKDSLQAQSGGIFNTFVKNLFQDKIHQREIEENKYEDIELSSNDFLVQNPNNFCYGKSDLDKIIYRQRKSYHTYPLDNNGILYLYPRFHKKEKFIIYPPQDVQNILEHLSELGIVIEIK